MTRICAPCVSSAGFIPACCISSIYSSSLPEFMCERFILKESAPASFSRFNVSILSELGPTVIIIFVIDQTFSMFG